MSSAASERLVERVESVLQREVRPALSSHAGTIRLLRVVEGAERPKVHLELTGSCTSCYFRRSCVAGVVRPALAEGLGADADWVVENARI
jgi:Fe-S cluster biogenesis protein NfuA